MCGRFTQYFTYAELHEFWSMFIKSDAPAPLGNLQPRYHICPNRSDRGGVADEDGLEP